MANINQVASYYKFDEASTNGTADEIIDSSFVGGGSGQALQAVNLIEGSGKFNNLLDGSNGTARLTCVNSAAFAISFWVKPVATDIGGGYKCVFEKTSDWYFEFYGNKLLFRNYAGSVLNIYENNWVADTWYHVVASVGTNGQTKTWVNGVADVDDTATSMPTNTNPINLFGWGGSDSSERYLGNLDELAIYTQELDQTAVNELYNSGNGFELTPISAGADWSYTADYIRVDNSASVTLQDFADYDTQEGLGYISVVENVFRFNKYIILNNSNLIDTEKIVHITTDPNNWCHLQSDSTAIFGILKDAEMKTTDEGITIYWDEESSDGRLFLTDDSSSVKLYSCHIYKIGGSYGNIRTYDGELTMYNCICRNIELWDNYNCDIYNFQSENSNYVLSNCNGVFDKIELRSANTNMYGQAAGNYTLKNVTVIDGTYILKMQTAYSGAYRLINTESDTWEIWYADHDGGKLHREYEYDLIVVETDGTKIEDARVHLFRNDMVISSETDYEASSTIDHEYMTDANGTISTSVVEYGYYHNPTLQVINPFFPHKLRLRKYGLMFSSLSKTLEHKSSDTVVLYEETTIAQSEATAQAHTGITITEHAPMAENGKNWSITLDCGNNSLEDTWHFLQWKLAQAGSYGTRECMEWHNLLKRDGTSFMSSGGNYDDSGTLNYKGVRVINYAGTISKMQSDDSSFYIPPISATLSIVGLQVGSDVVILEAGTSNVLSSVDQTSGNSFYYAYTTVHNIDIGIIKAGYITLYQYNYELSSTDANLPINQLIDRSYE